MRHHQELMQEIPPIGSCLSSCSGYWTHLTTLILISLLALLRIESLVSKLCWVHQRLLGLLLFVKLTVHSDKLTIRRVNTLVRRLGLSTRELFSRTVYLHRVHLWVFDITRQGVGRSLDRHVWRLSLSSTQLSQVHIPSKVPACHLRHHRRHRLTTCILRKRRCHLLYNLLLLLKRTLLLLGLLSGNSCSIMCDSCVHCCSSRRHGRWLIHKHFTRRTKNYYYLSTLFDLRK